MIYDKFAKTYDQIFTPFERWFLDKWRAETLSHLPKDSKILEIGAGTGLNFKHYPNCQKAVATEISIKMLRFAEQKAESIHLVQTDAARLPFPEKSFDSAVATLVFCSIPDPQKAFTELQRVLNPKDRIILLEHVRPDGLFGLLFDVLNLFTVALLDDHFNRQTAKIAQESGVRILEVKRKAFGVVNLIVCEVP